MTEPSIWFALAATGLVALSILVLAGLKGWQGWLELKRMELAGHAGEGATPGRLASFERIEVADLKERVRKLEAIASCIDL
jgi:hypothetical protein